MAVAGKWKKVLLSGSNFAVTSITASGIGPTSNGSGMLFTSNSGKFQSTGSFFINSNGDLFGPSFSGSAFSGSITGDGSNITGVSNDFTNALSRGGGLYMATSNTLISAGGSNISYDGSTAATLRIHLLNTTIRGGTSTGLESTDAALLLVGNGSGLTFIDESDSSVDDYALAIDAGFAGGGLLWNGNNTPGTSGGGILDIGAGSGIYVVGDVVSIDSASLISAQTNPGQLDVNSNGLFVNTNHFVESGDSFHLAGGTNISVAGVSPIDISNDPSFAILLDQSISGNHTFTNNINIQGDLTVVNSSNVTQIQGSSADLNIESGFLYLNSGSTSDNGGIVVDTGGETAGAIKSGSALGHFDGVTRTIAGVSIAAVGWAIYDDSFPSDTTNTSFGTGDYADPDTWVDTRENSFNNNAGATISTAMIRNISGQDPNDQSINNVHYRDGNISLDKFGSFFIDIDSAADLESNVFVYVPFDEG